MFAAYKFPYDTSLRYLPFVYMFPCALPLWAKGVERVRGWGVQTYHERTKEQYARNPDIDISRNKDNFHVIQPAQRYRREIQAYFTEAEAFMEKKVG